METKLKIDLNEIKKIGMFLRETPKFKSNVDLVSGTRICDAKSIMGVLSFDLSFPVWVEIHSVSEPEIQKFNEAMKPFLI